ncbi:unnamed protein product, partial [Brenthis ino]
MTCHSTSMLLAQRHSWLDRSRESALRETGARRRDRYPALPPLRPSRPHAPVVADSTAEIRKTSQKPSKNEVNFKKISAFPRVNFGHQCKVTSVVDLK